jgi:glycosyltransferase involved in cell wall biosynthesis
MFLKLEAVEDFLSNLYVYELVIFYCAVVVFLVQLLFYLFVYGKVARYKVVGKPDTESNEPVSIIVCARNELDNLTQYLPLILKQEYPTFEVIVVNDCSSDNSQDMLEKMQAIYPHLKITHIKEDEKFSHGKKLALTIGIKAATYEWLLLTDADCMPESENWLATMGNNFKEPNEIVLGYGGYFAEKGFLNRLIRFDTYFIAVQYFGFALCRIPYMGVGRNLAYRKSLFIKNKGFASHSHLQSGDDDLFINEVANTKNTTIELSLAAHTRSVPKKTVEEWVNQKSRHFSTANRYKFIHKFLIGFESFTRMLFYLSVILLLFQGSYLCYIGLGMLFIRMVIQLSVYSITMKKLNEKKLLLFSLVFDIILPLINIFLYTVNSFKTKQHKWK